MLESEGNMTFDEWWDKSVGLGDCPEKSLNRNTWNAAVAAEREACAALCEEAMRSRFADADSPVRTSFGKDLANAGGCMAEDLANAIKSRSNAGDNPPQPQRNCGSVEDRNLRSG